MASTLFYSILILYAVLSAVSSFFIGTAVEQLGPFKFTLPYLFKLALNPSFILAILIALICFPLGFYFYNTVGIARGRFILDVQLASALGIGVVVFKERPSPEALIGMVLVLIGGILIAQG